MHLSSPATTIFSDFREALLELITNYSSEVPLVMRRLRQRLRVSYRDHWPKRPTVCCFGDPHDTEASAVNCPIWFRQLQAIG